MRLSELTDRYSSLGAIPDKEINGIAYDSRQVHPGNLFFALPGMKSDGHEFVGNALAKGAIGAVVKRDRLPSLPRGATYLIADDTREALAYVAAAFWGFPAQKIRCVGVTGTNGKTTTVHLIEKAMLACGWQAGVIGTLGAKYTAGSLVTTVDLGFTTPQAPELQQLLWMMSAAGVRGMAMEVSSHALDQGRADHIGFSVAIFTNLTRDHLDYHGCEAAYAAAKAKLFASLDAESWAVINADDPHATMMRDIGPANVLTYSLSSGADFWVRDPQLGPWGSSGTLVTPEGEWPLQVSLPGRFNLYNALAALCACRSLGLESTTVIEAMAHLEGVPGRVERVTPADHPFMVMVDYAHTPDGLDNVLRTARDLTRGRLLVVFGCGGDRDRSKRPMMGRVASELADIIYVTSDNPRSERPEAIIHEIEAGMTREHRVVVDRAEAIGLAIFQARPGDTVVLAGKGHEAYQVVAGRRIPFDDREVARQALRRRQADASPRGDP